MANPNAIFRLEGGEAIQNGARSLDTWSKALRKGDLSDPALFGKNLQSAAYDRMKNSVKMEFSRGAWLSGDPTGERTVAVPWKAPDRFKGDGGAGPLVGSGALRDAWTGSTANSINSIGKRRITIGVKGGRRSASGQAIGGLPYAAAFRGLSGKAASGTPRKTFLVKPRRHSRVHVSKRTNPKGAWQRPKYMPKMFFKLWFGLGTYVSLETVKEGLKHFTRPHGFMHPDLTKEIEEIYREGAFFFHFEKLGGKQK